MNLWLNHNDHNVKQNNFALSASFNFILCFVMAFIGLSLTGCGGSKNEGSTRVGYGIVAQSGAFNQHKYVSQGLYLESKDLKGESAAIHKGEYFSLKLISAFICDFHEESNPIEAITDSLKKNENEQYKKEDETACNGGDGGQNSSTKGEIVILANIGEASVNKGLTFDRGKRGNDFRLVYYNDDIVETGQLINALNIPIDGPVKYNGSPYFMDFKILELDSGDNAINKNLLKNIAAIGGAAFPGLDPTLNLVNSLGKTIIDSNQDDLEMNFQLETDYAVSCNNKDSSGKTSIGNYDCDHSKIARMPLREGYYAFVRSELRSKDINMRDFELCADYSALCHTTTTIADSNLNQSLLDKMNMIYNYYNNRKLSNAVLNNSKNLYPPIDVTKEETNYQNADNNTKKAAELEIIKANALKLERDGILANMALFGEEKLGQFMAALDKAKTSPITDNESKIFQDYMTNYNALTGTAPIYRDTTWLLVRIAREPDSSSINRTFLKYNAELLKSIVNEDGSLTPREITDMNDAINNLKKQLE